MSYEHFYDLGALVIRVQNQEEQSNGNIKKQTDSLIFINTAIGINKSSSLRSNVMKELKLTVLRWGQCEWWKHSFCSCCQIEKHQS